MDGLKNAKTFLSPQVLMSKAEKTCEILYAMTFSTGLSVSENDFEEFAKKLTSCGGVSAFVSAKARAKRG